MSHNNSDTNQRSSDREPAVSPKTTQQEMSVIRGMLLALTFPVVLSETVSQGQTVNVEL